MIYRTQISNPQRRNRLRAWLGRTLLLVACAAGLVLSAGPANAAFHLWEVAEVYSSADGSVQFVKLTNNSTISVETAMAGNRITCTGAGATVNTFTFPSSLTGSTLNKNLLIGTSNLATIPGGITPDYVFTNNGPFLFINSGVTNTVGIISSFQPRASYTNIPTDGIRSLRGLATSFTPVTNSPQNYNNESNSIVPVQFASAGKVKTNLVVTFRTATGVNGSAGPTYSVLFKTSITDSSWSALTNFTGDGTIKTVSNNTALASQRMFRLKAQ